MRSNISSSCDGKSILYHLSVLDENSILYHLRILDENPVNLSECPC